MANDPPYNRYVVAFLRDLASRIENDVATNLSFSLENEVVDVGGDENLFVGRDYSGRRTVTLSYFDKSAFAKRQTKEAHDGTTTE